MSLALGEDIHMSALPPDIDLQLQNTQIFDSFHAAAEETHPFFRLLHPCFEAVLQEAGNKAGARIFLRGVSFYELMAEFSDPVEDVLADGAGRLAAHEAAIFTAQRNAFQLLATGEESLEETQVETALLCALGKEVLAPSASYDSGLLHYGLVGISTMRMYHMSAARRAEKLREGQTEG